MANLLPEYDPRVLSAQLKIYELTSSNSFVNNELNGHLISHFLKRYKNDTFTKGNDQINSKKREIRHFTKANDGTHSILGNEKIRALNEEHDQGLTGLRWISK